LSVKVGHKHAVLCFCFLELGIRPSVFTQFKLTGEPPTGLNSVSCL
jgi:hypothetical protein